LSAIDRASSEVTSIGPVWVSLPVILEK